MRPRRALLLVADPNGLESFARTISTDFGVELRAAGETVSRLQRSGVTVIDVGGAQPDWSALLAEWHDTPPVDMVVLNLPPPSSDSAGGLAMIGPPLLRLAAREQARVVVLSDPADYPRVVQALQEGGVDPELRRSLALKAARAVVDHAEQAVSLLATDARTVPLPPVVAQAGGFPPTVTIEGELARSLRYGENPHQRAAFYRRPTEPDAPSLARAEVRQGRALSYTALVDFDAAVRVLVASARVGAVLIQHGMPCGVAESVALDEPLEGVFARARTTDPDHVYGAVVGLNRPVDVPTAHRLTEQYLEGVIAPGFSPAALRVLADRPSLRVLSLDPWPTADEPLELRWVAGGLLVQQSDAVPDPLRRCRVPTRRTPSADEWAALDLAWRVVRKVHSHGVVLARRGVVLGIGAGQVGRLDACRLAVDKTRRARHPIEGAVAASDGFFAFPDGLSGLARAGVKAIVQPGGSVRDAQVVAAADRLGLAIVMTGVRHFRH